jgi:hypothetical protein
VNDRPRALAVLIAVFLLGGILGSAGTYFWLRKHPGLQIEAQRTNAPSAPGRARRPDLLQLTPDQQARFGEIMTESRKQLDALRIEQIPKIEAIRSETNRRLSSILNEEQRKKFDAFLKEMESRRTRPSRGRRFERPPDGNREPGFGPPPDGNREPGFGPPPGPDREQSPVLNEKK